jgi:hypothetical protein
MAMLHFVWCMPKSNLFEQLIKREKSKEKLGKIVILYLCIVYLYTTQISSVETIEGSLDIVGIQ